MKRHPGAPVAALVAVLVIGGVGFGARGEEQPRPSITVTGTGRINAAPDVAEISVGVITQAPTAKDALAANNEAMTALLAVVKERGVAAKDVQTSSLSVAPQYSQPPRPPGGLQPAQEFVPRIAAYRVTATVRITARDPAKLGALLDAVVRAGANQMYGIAFRIGQAEKLLDQARKEAMADAKRTAELLAGESGMVLGLPVRIREGGASLPPPRPMMATRMAMAESAVPIAAGDQELSVTVEVEYELRPPK